MSWLTSIFSSGAATIVDSVGSAIDSLVTSDEERLQLKNELVRIQSKAIKDAENQALQAEKEITKRWTSDNEHLITRLVRPASYVFVLVLFAVMVLGDGNIGITIKEAYIPVIETLLATMTVAYFGARTLDKGMKEYRRAKDK